MLRKLPNNSHMSENEIRERLGGIKCWLLDMDGTVTLGEELIPGVKGFFESLKEQKYVFVTNNSSHGPKHYMKRLKRLGLKALRDEIVISTDAMVENIMREYENPVCHVIGTPEFEDEIGIGGIEIVEGKGEDIDAVLVGFDTTLTYSKLDIACSYIKEGIPYYAANPDKVCPLKDGKVMPDCGCIISFLETCTSKSPERVFGKPDTAMIDMIMSKFGFSKNEMAMVGDRIYTDMAFARNAGITGITVLTGESSLEDVTGEDLLPDFVFDNIADISEYL